MTFTDFLGPIFALIVAGACVVWIVFYGLRPDNDSDERDPYD